MATWGADPPASKGCANAVNDILKHKLQRDSGKGPIEGTALPARENNGERGRRVITCISTSRREAKARHRAPKTEKTWNAHT